MYKLKPLLFTFLFSLMACIAFAQTETLDQKDLSGKFVKYYNSSQPDSIFGLFSPDLKKNFPLDQTKAFIIKLHSNLGNLNALTFEAAQSGILIYKAQFDKGILTLNMSVEEHAIKYLLFKPYEAVLTPKMVRNQTKMALPVKGEWTVLWGGDNRKQNYHIDVNFQKNAFDIIMTNAQGKSYKTDGKTNEDYYAFGQTLMAPCDGEVILSVDGVKDNVPGSMNPMYTLGNSVLIKTKNNEYVLFAHFKQHSIKVKQGDIVKRGQILGICGNSGNSSEPHLHFHIQDAEDFSKTLGIKCYFDKLQVNGVIKEDYSPVKGDKIKLLMP